MRLSLTILLGYLIVTPLTLRAAEPDKQGAEFFTQKVVPLLKSKCLRCHGGGDTLEGELNLTDRKAILAGGESGYTVDLETPLEGMLASAVNYRDLKMPPTGKLSPKDIAVFEEWLKRGLPWSEDGKPIEVEHGHSGPPQVNAETKSHWAFQPPKRPEPPTVQNEDWIGTPIDAFILSRLEAKNLAPAEPLEKSAWLRRVTYDLTGLPPTIEEQRKFFADQSPDAYDRVIDRLLESPHYGEKWGRHWLDLVRYAESNSFERDGTKPFVWRYRDYVIRSFNADKPYDRFLMEQLAGDELPDRDRESVIATGYYRLGIWDDEPADRKLAMYDEYDDIVSTTGQAMLGLTINCARCHDHKLDPIPQKDYYGFVAFFRNIRRYGERSHQSVEQNSLVSISTLEQREKHDSIVAEHRERIRDLDRKIAEIEKRVKPDFIPVEHEDFKYDGRREALVKKRVPKILSREQFKTYVNLRRQRDHLRRHPPEPLERALAIKEAGPTAPPTHVLMRGNPHVEGDPVEPSFPSILSPPKPEIVPPAEGARSTNRRLALAKWISSNENPLTARVMINRIWQHHFGRGLVSSPSNFGLQGTAPTHPELLDWLAVEFMENGWSIKHMHRLMLRSSVYRMSSTSNAAAVAVDPANDLFWRFNPRRLAAEEVRDSILAATGSLNLDDLYGPSVYTVIPDAVLATQSRPGENWGKSSEDQQNRRTVYVHVKRSLAIPTVSNFDGPETDLTCPVRFSTTQPTQALAMLNSDFLQQQSRTFGDLLRQESEDLTEQVAFGLRRVTQRKPVAEEISRGVAFVNRLQSEHGVNAETALNHYCLLLLNLNEFLYLD